MKSLLLAMIVLTVSVPAMSQTTASSADELDQILEQKRDERMIPGVEIGTLICVDENGKWKICSGSEYEEIKGFATTIPYVNANKVPPGESKTDFTGIASISAGVISPGDYLCACEKNSGMVKRCDKTDFPYAKAISGANATGEKFKVKLLGYRR